MDSRSLFLFLLLSISAGASQSYFSGAFAKNIANVSSLIRTIVENGDKEASNANLFLSQIIMTATDIPAEAEGSGEKPEKKTFIPLTEFRKYATEYLESVAQQRATSELKMQLGESLRELRMENVRRKVSMDKFIEKFYGTPAAVKYNEFEDKMNEIEKNVINFFTMKNSRAFSLDVNDDVSIISKKLIELLNENEIFDLILANNRYNDDVFVKLFQHFRNYGIFLTFSSIINEIEENRELLNDTALFDEKVDKVTVVYKSFLNSIVAANARREIKGFTFSNSFTTPEVERLNDYSNLPTATNHHLFNFNWETEVFEEKYAFLTVRRCGELAFNASLYNQSEVYRSHGECTTSLYRSPLNTAPENVENVGRLIQKRALEVLSEDVHYKTNLGFKLLHHFWLHGLIAIYTTCDKSTVSDTVYYDDRVNKVVVTTAAYHGYRDRHNYVARKNGVIQIIGYFMKPKNATY